MQVVAFLLVLGLAATGVASAQEGVRTRVDLRCLTAREEHCLPRPMSPAAAHGAICATCHDMVAQRTLAEARATCTAAGCHSRPETLTPFHRGLTPSVLSNCVHCHDPHHVEIPGGGANCVACHRPGARLAEPRSFDRTPLPGRRLAVDVNFRHEQHQRVECSECHRSEQVHARTVVTGLRDCRSCHHTQPQVASCTTCHERREVRGITRLVSRVMNIRLGSLDRPTRQLRFDHVTHERMDCQACHTGGLELSAASTDCSACHAAHHQPTVDCSACHLPPSPTAHTREAHLGCAGSGCHQAVAASIRDVPRTRSFCLSCHTDLVDHRPEGNCADCHVLPRPRVVR
jgi:hypothetical protein